MLRDTRYLIDSFDALPGHAHRGVSSSVAFCQIPVINSVPEADRPLIGFRKSVRAPSP